MISWPGYQKPGQQKKKVDKLNYIKIEKNLHQKIF